MISKSNLHGTVYLEGKLYLIKRLKTRMICDYSVTVVTQTAAISLQWEKLGYTNSRGETESRREPYVGV